MGATYLNPSNQLELNMTGPPTSLLSHERFTELCELACQEEDQDKLGAFFEEILQLLESQNDELDRAVGDGKPHLAVASAII